MWFETLCFFRVTLWTKNEYWSDSTGMQNDFGAFVIWGTGWNRVHACLDDEISTNPPRASAPLLRHHCRYYVRPPSTLVMTSRRVGSSPYRRANTTTIVCLTSLHAYTRRGLPRTRVIVARTCSTSWCTRMNDKSFQMWIRRPPSTSLPRFESGFG